MPKVSVVLTSYNQGKYLAASIESVLNQTFTDFELLICDDGSIDDSQKIIRSYDDARIKTFLYEKNRGSYFATQEPIQTAIGKYFALQHSDDIWELDKLEKQVQFLDENPQYEVCFTQAKFIDERGEPYELPKSHPYKNVFKQQNRTRAEWLNHLFWRANCFCNPTFLMRNARQNLFMNPCLFQLPDYLMWINLCLTKNPYVLPEELINFRLRRDEPNSVSSLSIDKIIRAHNELYFVARQFLLLLRDEKFFMEVFPEAEEFLIGNKISTEFAFAQFCLRRNSAPFQKLALEILYDLLHNESQRNLIKKLYNYDERAFIRDTGKFDVFNVKSQLQILNCRLYVDYGGESNLVETATLIKPDENFTAIFDFRAEQEITSLKFDFDDKAMFTIEISRITVNGEDLAINSAFTVDKKFSAGKIRIEIFGSIRKSAILQQKENQIKELQDIISAQAATINQLVNSNSWKITKPLRAIGKILKSHR